MNKMINSGILEDRSKENSGSNFSYSNSKDLSNLQTPKLKPRRPIILLRRNSLGNIPVKNENRKKSVKCPRLKSMENIHIKPKLLPLPPQKVKVENIMEFNSYEALNSPNFLPTQSENYNLGNGIKIERLDNQFPNASSSSSPYLFNNSLTPISNTPNYHQNPFLTPNRSNQPKMSYVNGNTQYFTKQEAGQFYQPNLPLNNEKLYQNQMLVSTPIGQHQQMNTPNNTQQSFVNSQKNQNPRPFSQSNEVQYNIVSQQQRFAHNSQPEYSNQFKVNYFNPNINQGGIIHQNPTEQPNFQQNIPNSNQIILNSNSQWQLRPNSNICESIVDDSLTNITWLGKMGVNNFMPVPLERERKFNHETKLCRPPYSYTALIQFAINSSSTGRMTLRQIYQWIEDKFPFFKTAKPGWKNSIRHNLSLHDIFVREVTTGSKASFWTLRPDLNQRPLTLDSVVSVDSLQGFNQSQKPILPRLPQCSQPYILLPIPLLQQQNENGMVNQQQQQQNNPKVQNQSIDMSLNATSSNNFTHDSGFNSDLSHCTPTSSGNIVTPQSSGTLGFITEKKEVSPMFPGNSNGFMKQTVQKRSRKEPLKILNDSLNSSITFLKENEETIPRPRVPLSPSSGHQFLLCKKNKSKNKTNNESSADLGFSDESFSELLNGLGSPFTALFNNPTGMTPKFIPERKRRRSWGSPESSGSGGNFRGTSKQENETTPPGVRIRRVKSEALDLHKEMKDVERPTSTPVCKNKWSNVEKQSRKSLKMEDNENKENEFNPMIEQAKLTGDNPTDPTLRIPSPIPLSSPEYGTDFFQDIMGTLFKTPDKPSAPSRHFESLTPVRPPFSDITLLHNADDNPGTSTTPSKIENLDSSFGKLLDLSAGSGCFSRFNNQFSNDASDLNLSWSNFSHL